MKMISYIFILSVISGCALVDITPINDNNKTIKGLRAYAPKPILIITNGSASISYIPNYSKAYAINYHAFLAKNHSVTELDNGIVKKIDTNLDTTALITLIDNVLTKAVEQGEGVKSLGENITGTQSQSILIYEFIFNPDGSINELKRLPLAGLKDSAATTPPSEDGTAFD